MFFSMTQVWRTHLKVDIPFFFFFIVLVKLLSRLNDVGSIRYEACKSYRAVGDIYYWILNSLVTKLEIVNLWN